MSAQVIPFPVREKARSDRDTFMARLCKARIAELEWRLQQEISCLAGLDGENPAQGPLRDASDKAGDHYRVKLLDLVFTPAPDKRTMEMKRSQIGRMWLKAPGDFYDLLRAGLEKDRERLTAAALTTNA